MGSIARVVAIAGLTAVTSVGFVGVASAQEVASGRSSQVEQAPAATASIQSRHVQACGNDYNWCYDQLLSYKRFGYGVGPINYSEGQTCPGGAACADGYWFYYYD